MKLRFLGTRGYIDARNRRHWLHTSLEVRYRGRRIMIDCGEDWRRRVHRVAPDAIAITHAHPDHAFGLKDGVRCPVYATAESWEIIHRFPVADRRIVAPRRPFRIGSLVLEAFPVEHSLRAPAVGYRITAGEWSIFYVSDLVEIGERRAALQNVRLYIGDGASLTRPIIRRRDGHRIGHIPVRTQLDWCAEEGVPRMVVTHCGSQIVEGDERMLAVKLERLAAERGVEVTIARDGMEMAVR